MWQRVHPVDRRALALAVLAARRSGLPQTTRLRVADTDGTVLELAVTCRSAGRRRLWGTAEVVAVTTHDSPSDLAGAQHRAHQLISDNWHAAMVPRTPPPLSTADLATAARWTIFVAR